MKKKKAPKILKKKAPGYVDGGQTLAYQMGDPSKQDDTIYKPEKKGKGTFGESLWDIGVGASQVGLGLLGADDLVKDSAYKTAGGQQFGRVQDKYLAPVEATAGKIGLNVLGATIGDPMLGSQVQAAGKIANTIVDQKRTARLPNETDSQYSKRMADMGIDITTMASDAATQGAIQTGLESIAPGLEQLIGGQGKKDGGVVTVSKAKEILKDGTVHGKPLTDKQKKYFGFIAGGGRPGFPDGGDIPAEVRKPDFTASGTSTIVNQLTNSSPKDIVSYFPAINKDGTIDYYRGSMKMTPTQIGKDSLYSKDSINFPLNPTQGYKLSAEEAQKAYQENPSLFWHGAFPGGFKTEYGKPFEYGKAEGGEIEGKGGPKDDAIKAKIKPGSFVVPAEHAHIAEEIRKKFLGNDKKAKLKQAGGTDVRLSNGEHLFTKDEKEYLMNEHGIDLDELAPNAKDGRQFKEGTTDDGVPYENKKSKTVKNNEQFSDYYTADNGVDKVDEGYQVPDPYADQTKADINLESNKQSAKKGFGGTEFNSSASGKSESTAAGEGKVKQDDTKIDWSKYMNPENALSLAQILYGRKVLQKAGSRPVDVIDPAFNAAVNKAVDNSAFGYGAAEKSLLKSDIESNRRAMTDAATSLGGGNFATSLANTRAAGNVASKNLIELAAADAELKSRKEQAAAGLIRDRAAMQRQLFNDKMHAFDVNQQAGSALLNAGIENFFGSRRYDKQLEAEKEQSSNFDPDALVKWMETHNLKNG